MLRHQPEKVGITLDREGWVSVSRQLEALEAHSERMTFDELREVVRANDKQRFSFSPVRQQGLLKGRRHHVHLSEQEATALAVGGRYCRFVVLRIASGTMHADGYPFFRSANGVWLTEHVPTRYITFGADDSR